MAASLTSPATSETRALLMHSTGPWHLTVLRAHGLRSPRPEKSWRPIVTISVIDQGYDPVLLHEIVLGCDGQNPNLRLAFQLHDVQPSTRLVLQVFYRSQTKKKHRKRTLVGSADLSLGEFLSRHPLPHPRPVEYNVCLSCPPSQRKSPTIGGKQLNGATLTIKVAVPHPAPHPSRPGSPLPDECIATEAILADAFATSGGQISAVIDGAVPERPWGQPLEPEVPDTPSRLRRRRRQRRGFNVDGDSEADLSDSSEEPWIVPTSPVDYLDGAYDDGSELEGASESVLQEISYACMALPNILPVNIDQGSMSRSLSFVQAVANTLGPYQDLCEADDNAEKMEKILDRLLNQWYLVGASLLALAAIDAAVFGFAPDAAFTVDSFSRSVVAISAIAAGIGLVSDAWFLLLYNDANAAKFQRIAKDMYDSYFFFCLTCRLPTMCMFVSSSALMLFLLSVAWTASPTAVLVMSFVAGVLLSSQFLVFGIHRTVNFVVWAVRVPWRELARVRRGDQPPHGPQAQPVAEVQLPAAPRATPAERARDGIQTPMLEPTAV